MLHLLFLFVFSCFGGTKQLFDSELVVTWEDPKDFVSEVITAPRSWVIFFYMPEECAKCELAAPEFEKAAKHNSGIINFAAVDCANTREGTICDVFKIPTKILPAILFFSSELDKIPESEAGGREGDHWGKLPKPYSGGVSASAITSWALELLHNHVISLTPDLVDDLLINAAGYKAVFFTNKKTVSPVLKSLSNEFSTITILKNNGLPFYQISSSEKELVDRFRVTTFPTLLVVNEHGEAAKYTDAMKYAPMQEWLSQFATPRNAQAAPIREVEEKAKEAKSPKKKNVLYMVDSKDSFEEACPKLGWCFVSFLDPSDEYFQENLDILSTVVKDFPSYRFLWIDGLRFASFKDSLEVLADGLPQALLLSRGKLLARPLRSAFSLELISEFLKISQQGKGKRNVPLEKDPLLYFLDKTDL